MAINTKLTLSSAVFKGLPLFYELWDFDGPVYRIPLRDCTPDQNFVRGELSFTPPPLPVEKDEFTLVETWITAYEHGEFKGVQRIDVNRGQQIHVGAFNVLNIDKVKITTD